MRLTDQQIFQYEEDGFVIVPGLFDTTTVQEMAEHYMNLRAEGLKPGDYSGTADHPEDANHKYPRMLNMHQWDKISEKWVMWPDLLTPLEQLLRDKPVIYQSMVYFKPPGARGQAFHQDQQYLPLDPLIGVWVALDDSIEPVGPMRLVPGSHRYGLLPVEIADTSTSFTDQQVTPPEGTPKPVRADMEPGDVLFWDGKVVHGSHPNVTDTRWRRSFICHFIGEDSKKFEADIVQKMWV